MSNLLSEPTSEQCVANARVTLDLDGDIIEGVACWYPQMGGYVGRCVIIPAENGTCFDVLVWHDGAFPFSSDGEDDPERILRAPARLHHCRGEQFVRFGELAMRVTGEAKGA